MERAGFRRLLWNLGVTYQFGELDKGITDFTGAAIIANIQNFIVCFGFSWFVVRETAQ